MSETEDTVAFPAPLAPERDRPQEGTRHDHSVGSDDRGLRAARARASRPRVRAVVPADVAALTVTVVIPAHNEERDLGEALDALMRQTAAPERIIIVDDGSTDRTSLVAAGYPVEIVRNEKPLGNKARVVNYVAPEIDTDLIINLDADTVVADDYCERIKVPFADPQVAVTAGIVLTWNPHGVFQKARSIEYLFGQHLYRPLQHAWGSITVCPGCACAYRREPFVKAGGFPEGGIAEDMLFTLQAMTSGYKTAYVADAECYVVDPANAAQLKAQLWRWMAGYMQAIRMYWRGILHRKRILALLLLVSIWDIFALPLLAVSPFLFEPSGVGAARITEYVAVAWLSSDLLITLPVVLYGAHKRGISAWWALANFPLLWLVRTFNLYFTAKAMIWELFLVPLGWAKSLDVWVKGH
jgi:N-acetylglucosaminyltransferase